MRISTLILSSLTLLALTGCGGSPSAKTNLTGGESVQTIGSLVTRIVGTAQPPVIAGSSGAVVTGLAGATISALDQFEDQPPPVTSVDRIAWAGDSSGNYEIWIKNADGSGDILNLSNNPNQDHTPEWSPDGTKIAWYGQRNGLVYDILIKNADGTGTEFNLTNSSASDFRPRWSPDGTKIAWERDGRIVVKNADGSGNIVNVTTVGSGNIYPEWSPDGAKIVWNGQRNGNPEIVVKNADGTGGEINLSNNTGWDHNPQWSPDGAKIVWNGERNGNHEILIKNADGSGNEVNFTNDAGWDSDPQWSPDGSKIVWSGYRNGNIEILSKNADGSGNLVNISNSSGPNLMPQWSPDGTRIVWETYRSGNREVVVKKADGTGPETSLSSHPGQYSNAQWGKTISVWPRVNRSLLGPSGILGTNAAGFLVGQQGQAVTSVVAFNTLTAATRANARISTTTGIAPDLPNIVFTVTAGDALTSLRYINGPGTTGIVTAIGPGSTITTASGAILSFSSTDGTLVATIPYVANRAAHSEPGMVRSGEAWVVRGRFPAILDSAGKNLAPNGATEVHIDAKTGKLRDWK